MSAVIASVHLGCLVWQQAKLRDKRDDRVTHSRRMGKPTAPLTLYFSERGGHHTRVSSYLWFSGKSEVITLRRLIITSHKTTAIIMIPVIPLGTSV